MSPRRPRAGFTLIELVIIAAILAIIAAIAVPMYEDALAQAREVAAIADLRQFERQILLFEERNDRLPDTLAEAVVDPQLDPWGRPYFYFRFPDDAKKNVQGARADKNLRPVNSRYDLYSAGEDGKTKLQFTAQVSRDDIVRAADGSFFGRAED